MHQIACVESEYISPGVIYVDGKLRHPFRLYANEEGNVCVIVCEAPIMINGIHSVLNTVMDWAIKNAIQEVLVLDGIAVQGIPRSDRQTIILGSTEMDENIKNIHNTIIKIMAHYPLTTQISQVILIGMLSEIQVKSIPHLSEELLEDYYRHVYLIRFLVLQFLFHLQAAFQILKGQQF